ncbi:peptidylprolyl isomerase [Actinophytocola glycyrrhizae]|uniref:Peptidylprolyl isomerase n=1 Tax=Actinophytocola glycyrrhizae TaxID=2044873 RepID=A0ABV9SC64_9PSEU
MNILRTSAVVAAIGLTLAGCVARENPSSQRGDDDFPTATAEETTSAEDTAEGGTTTEGECGFGPDQSGSEPSVGLPPDEGPVDATTLSLTTSAGPLTIQLDAERAPCTVQSMVFLAGEGFFDGTNCHRLTTSEGLRVLQCGDPAGNGSGGPGYVVPDEFPTDLPPSADGSSVTYPRGTVAMANAGPGTTGSQFFLVYADSTLPPEYTVFGTLDEASLATLDQVAAAGVAPGGNSPQDGAPVTPVTIESAEAA